MFSARYSRQILQWGEDKQKSVESSTILIAGLGGLGSTVSQIMVRAGIGCLYLVDDGTVEWPDLNRQTLYIEDDVGRNKLDVAVERLSLINSASRLEPILREIGPFFSIPEDVDIVVDCLDNFCSRNALFGSIPDQAAFIHGAVQGDFGQVVTLIKGRSAPFEEVFSGCRQPCGVIPVTPEGALIVAGLICREVFSLIFGTPKLLDRMLVLSLEDFNIAFLDL